MSDARIAELLRSSEPLVVIEAPAGCGKTYQGASYAKDIIPNLGNARLLILTHTHAACSVFAARTRGSGQKVEIKTIDALISQIATIYHESLGLPRDISTWAWQDNGKGFDVMAEKVAHFLNQNPIVANAMTHRYPIIICDEHQDSSIAQHNIIMALFNNGSKLRIFGDPLQQIYTKTDKASVLALAQWENLKHKGIADKLHIPHRWTNGCANLGNWVLEARECLESGNQIDLTRPLPSSVRVLIGNNIAPARTGYQLTKSQRQPIDDLVKNSDQLMILASQNELIFSLNAFWYRTIPIWEGHTRNAFANLTLDIRKGIGNPICLATALVQFFTNIGIGFTMSSHGERLIQEIKEGCTRSTTGKPAHLQAMAKILTSDPTHKGVSAALTLLQVLIEQNTPGFEAIKVDLKSEFKDAIRMGQFADGDTSFSEIARKRSYSHPNPARRVLSTIHKAKGLECDNVLLMACDKSQFSKTNYAKCKMYVALSRAKKSLTLVLSDTNPSPIFKI